MHRKILRPISILALSTALFSSLAYAQPRNGISVTPGRIAKWADGTGSLTDSQINEDPDTGNFGIGTTITRPLDKLTLQTPTNFNGFVQTDGDVIVGSSVGTGPLSTNGGWYGTASNHPLRLFTNSSVQMTINPNGNIGIGWEPQSDTKLAVIGSGVAVLARSNGDVGVLAGTNNPNIGGVEAQSAGASTLNIGLRVYGRSIVSGTKSASVPLREGENVLLYTEESTEIWFSDYGSVQLISGHAAVTLDPEFLRTVDTERKYHVFVTANGNPGGSLYIDNKTPGSFEIRETGGTANIDVSYRIVAKRKGFADERLKKEPTPKPQSLEMN
jgi:hypothetical protein